MKHLGLTLLLSVLFSLFSIAQQDTTRTITISSPNYDQDYFVLGYYYGDRQLVLDTIRKTEGNTFNFESENKMNPGVYLLLLSPSNRYIQFLINEEEGDLAIAIDTNDLAHPEIRGSKDNELFLNYISFLGEKGKQNQALAQKLQEAQNTGMSTEEIEKERLAVDEEVKAYQQDLIKSNPNSITSKLIRSTLDVIIPEFSGTDEEIKNQQYYYYRGNYFEHIDLADPVNLRTPFFHNKIDNYLNKLTPQAPDSINLAIDYLLTEMENAEETYKFYLSYFLNTYAQSKVVGQDAVYVHLVDQYYGRGKAPWVEKEQLDKIITEANKIRPTLIGKIAQDIKVYRKDKSPISISDIDTKYLILYFWAPDCGHCKKATPHVIEYYNKVKDSLDIEILAVCTKHRDKEADCWDAVEEKGMDIWINASDLNHTSNFRGKYNIQQTPSIFILNEEREIIMKKIGAEYLDEVMQEIIRIDDLNAMEEQKSRD